MPTSDVNVAVDDSVHRHPEIEHFLNLNTVLHSLVDFIRPEIYIASDELETYNELKDKFLRESTSKRNKQQQQHQQQSKSSSSKSPLEVAGVQSIRATSGIYRFLAHHHKNNSSVVNNKQKPTTPISRDELLKKLHEKMPHRQKQEENGIDHTAKRKLVKDQSKERQKRPRTSIKEWSSTPSDSKPSIKKPPTIPTQLTFGRFNFNTEDSLEANSKKKKPKKFQSKQKQLVNTLKKVESEQNELTRLQQENPDEGKELLRSKHWQTALAKAKGEKLRDNVQLLRKSIKKTK